MIPAAVPLVSTLPAPNVVGCAGFHMYLAPSFLIVAVLLVLRDATDTSPATAASIFSFVAFIGLCGLAADVLAASLSPWLRRQHAWWGIGLVNVGVPGIFGAYRALAGDEPLWWGFGAIIAVILLCTVAVTVASRCAMAESPRVVLCWSLLSLGMFLYVHVETGTLFSLRKGTETLHLFLFLGTWLAGMLLPLAAYIRQSKTATESRGLALTYSAVLLLFALGTLEIDRYALVDLYPAVHVWLGLLGILTIGQALAVLLPVVLPAGRNLLSAFRVSLILLGGSAVGLVLLGPELAGGMVRSRIAHVPLGVSLLEFMPARDLVRTSPSLHPSLAFEQHLTAPPLTPKPNVLFVTVDALRSDALRLMPKFGKRLSSCAVFERAYAQGTRTAIGMGTLMTGRYSARMDWDLWTYSHGSISNFSTLTRKERQGLSKRLTFTTLPRVPDGNMLAERLRTVGYETSAVPFAGQNEFFRSDLVFARGFDHFVDLTEHDWKPPTSKRVMKQSLSALAKARSPWFHWVHLYDPHEAERSKARYKKFVRAVDDALSQGLANLGEQLSNTALILLADHGEAFGEHRHQGHGTSLYEEQALVPFVLCLPGGEEQRFADPVAAIDATATLAAMTGASTRDLDGVNLLPMLDGQANLPTRPIFTELHRYKSSDGAPTTDLKAVIFEGRKLILDRRKGTEEFYDLNADPGETHNLAGEDSAQQTLLREILTSFLSSAERAHPLPDVSRQPRSQ